MLFFRRRDPRSSGGDGAGTGQSVALKHQAAGNGHAALSVNGGAKPAGMNGHSTVGKMIGPARPDAVRPSARAAEGSAAVYEPMDIDSEPSGTAVPEHSDDYLVIPHALAGSRAGGTVPGGGHLSTAPIAGSSEDAAANALCTLASSCTDPFAESGDPFSAYIDHSDADSLDAFASPRSTQHSPDPSLEALSRAESLRLGRREESVSPTPAGGNSSPMDAIYWE